jgi:DNA-binding transcriptional LysR family regulator
VEIRQLAYFVAVAEEAHFHRAARRVAISQPALSHQIARLEEELGVRLLERSRRHVELTEAGQVLLRAAKKLLADLDDAAQETRRAGTFDRRLTIGFPEYMGARCIGPTLRLLSETAPDVEVEISDLPYEESVLRVLAAKLDVGMAMSPVTDPDLARRPVIRGRWTVVLPQGHPLAKLDEVPLASLADERIIFFNRSQGPLVHDRFIELCRAAGFEPRIVYRTSQARNGPALVADGMGVFVGGSYVLEGGWVPSTVVARPLTGFDASIELCLVWRADNRSPVLRVFLDAAKICSQSLQSPPGEGQPQAP